MKKIAVVILNYNGKELLEKFLPIVVKNSPQATVYVADNGSKDGSVEWISTHFPEAKCIVFKENLGYAKGYNQALKNIKEPYACLLNSDVEVTENWLSPIENIFDSNPEIGIIQPKILDYSRSEFFEYAGAAGGFIDALGFPYCRGRVFETIEKDNGQYEEEKIFWASGACLFIRTDIFQQLDGFDEYFFAHQEEIDLCWRAFHRGILAYFTPKSVVYHIGGASLKKTNPKKTFLNFRNSLIMLYKNLPTRYKFFKIFKRLCYDGIAGIKFLLEGKPTHCWAVVRAHFAFYYYLFFAKNTQKVTGNRAEHYYHCKDIVSAYFLKKKKYFHEL